MKLVYEKECDGLKIEYHREIGEITREVYNGKDTQVIKVKAPKIEQYVGLIGICIAELGITYLGWEAMFYTHNAVIGLLTTGFGLGPAQGITRLAFERHYGDYNNLKYEISMLKSNDDCELEEMINNIRANKLTKDPTLYSKLAR